MQVKDSEQEGASGHTEIVPLRVGFPGTFGRADVSWRSRVGCKPLLGAFMAMVTAFSGVPLEVHKDT